MIKNEKQYKITKVQLNLLAQGLKTSDNIGNDNIHPILIKAQRDAVQSQYNELSKQIEVYELLKAGKFSQLDLESFDLLPQGLIKARIARGMSQKDLAESLGLKEQQIQKYEATDYASASFERLKQVINALNLRVREEIFLSSTSFNQTQIFKNLSRLGIPKEFVITKLLPVQIVNKLQSFNELAESEAQNVLNKITAILSKVFGFSIDDLLNPGNLTLNVADLPAVRYKKTASANPQKVSAYTIYAHLLALALHQSSKIQEQSLVPEDAEVVRQEILNMYGKINFETVIRYIWSLGIPVLVLNDSGAFHGACWRVDGFNMIVLKQQTMSESKWVHDALHELCHASQHPNRKTLQIIESDDNLSKNTEAEEEDDANYYAADIYLGENADEIAEECIEAARDNMSNLKREVIRIAQKYKIDLGGLANYIAFRLAKEQEQNWWGTASNLQTLGFSPYDISRKLIFEHCDLAKLNDFDKDLLIKAII
jgi:transcriptional regulator with XRE-family HTH domain/Zn-dependent peptidase ImmA (M78 family)